MADDHVEYFPNDWRNPVTRNALKVFEERSKQIEDKYIRLMASHISELGRLKASDITRLEQMRRLSRNMNEIQKEIAKAAHISDTELQSIFEATCAFEGNDFLKQVVDQNRNINWQDNDALKTAMQAQIRVTQGRLENFSRTYANSTPYVRAVDSAIMELQTGLTDHQTVIRNAIKQCASQGLTVVQYETKYKNGKPVTYHRRLDSALRQNVLDGIRDLAQERMNIIGRETGCNGVEISAHQLCATDHLEWQGEQMYNQDFEALQGSLARPYGEWNCRHWWTPIIMGLVDPTYSKEELEQYKSYSREEITIESESGKEITKSRYQWTQEQRRLETAVRKQKDIIAAAKAQNPADTQTIREAQNRIKQYQSAYSVIGDKAGIGEQRWRMTSHQGIGNSNVSNHESNVVSVQPQENTKANYGNAVNGIENSVYRERAQQYLDNAPQNGRDVWQYVQEDLNAPSFETKYGLQAYFDPVDRTTHYVDENKAFNKSDYQSEMVVYFHEYGHNIDYLLGHRDGLHGYYSDLYNDGEFKNSVMRESRSWFESWLETNTGYSSTFDLFEYIQNQQNEYGGIGIESYLRDLITDNAGKDVWRSVRSEFRANSSDPNYLRSIFEKYASKNDLADIRKSYEMRYFTKQNALDFCKAVKEKLSIYQRTDVSDMIEPYMVQNFGIDYPFGLGHGKEYIKNDFGATESFAEMYSAMMTQNESLDIIKAVYPESYRIFVEMLSKK